MRVPFTNLRLLHAPLAADLHRAVEGVVKSGSFAGGPTVRNFEEQFAQFCGTTHAVGVGSGTDALWLVLTALDAGRGDEIITVPNTFIATAAAIAKTGAKPVFVDVDPMSGAMDPAAFEAAITPRTCGVIPVHLFGRMASMDAICRIARRHGLFVVEDACQAHGAESNGRMAGSWGDAGCFSFYPSKNLGAFGEAGAVVTNRRDLATKVKALREHGQTSKDIHAVVGTNSRMDAIHAAVLSVKLPHLAGWNSQRRAAAHSYDRELASLPELSTPLRCKPEAAHVYHLYVVRVSNRDAVLRDLASRQIEARIHYPLPIHLQESFAGSTPAGSLPNAERLAGEILSLPFHPDLSPLEVRIVTTSLREILHGEPKCLAA